MYIYPVVRASMYVSVRYGVRSTEYRVHVLHCIVPETPNSGFCVAVRESKDSSGSSDMAAAVPHTTTTIRSYV